MIIIKINDINFGLGNKAFYSYFRNILDQSYHLTHCQSLRIPLFNISTVTPHFFLTKIKKIPIQLSFINILKFHEFGFFKLKYSAKSSIFPYIFHTKKAKLDIYFKIIPVSLQSQ